MTKALTLIIKGLRRITVFVFGTGVVGLGLVLIPLPGPGLLVVVLGLAILSTEFTWAQVALEITQRRAKQSKNIVLERWHRRRQPNQGERSGPVLVVTEPADVRRDLHEGVVHELPDRRNRAPDERAFGS